MHCRIKVNINLGRESISNRLNIVSIKSSDNKKVLNNLLQSIILYKDEKKNDFISLQL